MSVEPLTIRRIRRLLTVLLCLLVAAGLALLAAAMCPYSELRGWLDSLAGDGEADVFTETMHQRLRLAAFGGVILSGVAAAIVMVLRHPRYLPLTAGGAAKFVNDMSLDLSGLWRRLKAGRWWIPGLLIAAAFLRCPYWTQPMRYDEAHTYIRYASRPLPLMVAEYDEPNNHVLHSVCVWICTQAFGDSEPVIRSPALVAGLLVPVFVFLLANASCRPLVAGLSGLLTAFTPVMVFYSVNARGYSIGCLLLLLAAMAARPALRRGSLSAWLVLIIAMALAMWTIPTMVYGVIAMLAVLAAELPGRPDKSRMAGTILIAGLATALLTATLYLPIILTTGVGQLGHVAATGSGSFRLWAHLSSTGSAIAEASGWATQAVPGWCQVFLAGGLLTGLMYQLWNPDTRRQLVGPAAVLVVLMLHGVVPPGRTWCFVMPYVAMLIVQGIDGLGWRIADTRRSTWTLGICLLLTLAVATGMVQNDYVKSSDETGRFPEGQEIAGWLASEIRPAEPVVAVTPVSAVVIYYSLRSGIPADHFMMPGQGHTNDHSCVAIVDGSGDGRLAALLTELQLSQLFPAQDAELLTVMGQAQIFRIQGER